MYGIFWKWLIFFGFLFWVALCAQEYYRQVEYENEYRELEEKFSKNAKGQPPCLTFWKAVSMVLSLSALVYIKRTSNLRRNLGSNYVKQEEIEPPSYSVHMCSELKPTEIVPDIYSETKNYGPKAVQGITGVEMVQQKLDSLEKTVQNLKKRHISNTTFNTGIVSGSPEFRKFLSKLPPTELTQNLQNGNSNLMVSNSELSIEVHVDQNMDEKLESSQYDDTYDDTHKPNEPDLISNQENSWSTISEAMTEYSDAKIGMSAVSSNQLMNTPLITEILQARHFADIKSSADEKSIKCLESVLNMITESAEYDDDSEVPGSNLVPSEKSSVSSRHRINFFPSLSSLDDDDLLLNTLD